MGSIVLTDSWTGLSRALAGCSLTHTLALHSPALQCSCQNPLHTKSASLNTFSWQQESKRKAGAMQMQERKVWSLTLSPARILKEAITWSAVSVSAVSRDMKSMKAWNVTTPKRLGSTMLMMRANSASPWRTRASCKPGHLGSSAMRVGRNRSAAYLTARETKPNRNHFCSFYQDILF